MTLEDRAKAQSHNASGDDIVEISNNAELDIIATYGKPARHIEVRASEGSIVKLEMVTGEQRTVHVYDKWARALYISKILAIGAADGVAPTLIQLTF